MKAEGGLLAGRNTRGFARRLDSNAVIDFVLRT